MSSISTTQCRLVLPIVFKNIYLLPDVSYDKSKIFRQIRSYMDIWIRVYYPRIVYASNPV